MTKSVFRHSGYQFKVERCGSGPNLLIIGSVDYYKKVVPKQLHQYFTCIYLDHRGFAKHSVNQPETRVSLQTISNDIQMICNELGIIDTCLLGHSGHAYMALHFATQTKININQVFLVGAAPSLSESMQAEQLAHWRDFASKGRHELLEKSIAMLKEDIADDPERKFVHICRRLGPMRWADPSFDEAKLWDGVNTNTMLLDHLWGKVFRDINVNQFDSSLDVTVIYGEYDFSIAPISCWSEFSGIFSSLKLITVKGAAHTPMYEQPMEFIKIISEQYQAVASRVTDRL
ncbi:alpha/beta fold hydrolase [Vibrio sonorensis]|uniref:alpha/beta fold hydrolase n=1 Tax=Vibrio sonorensis TaxID=1004316 RepID=UPI0008DA0D52|nr:alpha/beta hydrolase [Vibrio sonorensis]